MTPAPTQAEIERFMSHVVKTETCWLWTAYCLPSGYGKVTFRGKPGQLAHRVSYEMFVGEIPEGLTIDHVKDRGCSRLNCVRPDHLEAVTLMENRMRGRRINGNTGSALCKKGLHLLSGDNLYVAPGGVRNCKACRNTRLAAKRRQERKE